MSLTVTIYSFSFKKGIPVSGNGGGYVFDCRSIINPGRFEQYRHFTGNDAPVVDFIRSNGDAEPFMDSVYALVDAHVKVYISRDFTDLMVCFGCTGGQHRSVYCANALASHLATEFPEVEVKLIHREKDSWETGKV